MEPVYIKETPRSITLISDDRKYTISAHMNADQDGYGEFATYKGSTWVVCLYENGKRVNSIPYEYAETPTRKVSGLLNFYGINGFCQRGISLRKFVIIYGASETRLFTKALAGKDVKAAEKKWVKEYVAARIAEEEARIAAGL